MACPLESLGASPRDKSGYASTRSRAQPQACSRLLLKAPDKPMLGFEGSDEGIELTDERPGLLGDRERGGKVEQERDDWLYDKNEGQASGF